MEFAGDAFISYAHLDNVELVEGRKGWVANFHRALEVRVGQLLGKSPKIWRDPKLSGNDLFAETLVDRLKQVALDCLAQRLPWTKNFILADDRVERSRTYTFG